jgi:thiamine-monophosphate kinase
MPVDEFDLIATHLRPLAGEGAFGLSDDAAQMGTTIVSKDLLVEGIHFRADDPLETVAQKALRVNISDIVAKGARPGGYFLGMVWPRGVTSETVAGFARGLAADQKAFGVTLLGGDTTVHRGPAPLTISVTMTGTLEGEMVRRSGARPGDLVAVTGTIGDAGLGLMALEGRGPANSELIAAYRTPRPPFALWEAIGRHARAAIDVSDGLVADATHLARQSGVTLEIDLPKVPLSAPASVYLSNTDGIGAQDLIVTGDDYQTLMAVDPGEADALVAAAAAAGVELTFIGRCTEGEPQAVIRDQDGRPLSFGRTGWRH